MKNNLFNLDYHPVLIDIMIKGSFSGAFIVNIFTPTLLAYAFMPYIDSFILFLWFVLNMLIYLVRIKVMKKIESINYTKDTTLLINIKLILIIVFLTTMLYLVALIYSATRVPDLELFLMATLIVSMIAGSISTLVGVYHAFAIYVIFNSLSIVGVFLVHGGKMFDIFAITTFLFMLVMLRNGHKQYLSLSENIKLKESFEVRVKESLLKLKEREELLQHQSKLAQMGEMISMIAHQWRQPLSAISATSAALNLKAQLGKIDAQNIQEMTANISEYSQHLSETIDDFRNFFKPNKEKKEIYYDELLTSVYGIMESSLVDNNITLLKDLECKESFKSYPNELKQVILNLIKNAEDTLVEREIEKPYIKIVTYREGNMFILEVHDNGGGIDKSIIRKVFDPYFSTKLEKDGTGLGLYMSQMIIKEHCHGELSVSNSEDGAVFKLVLAES